MSELPAVIAPEQHDRRCPELLVGAQRVQDAPHIVVREAHAGLVRAHHPTRSVVVQPGFPPRTININININVNVNVNVIENSCAHERRAAVSRLWNAPRSEVFLKCELT